METSVAVIVLCKKQTRFHDFNMFRVLTCKIIRVLEEVSFAGTMMFYYTYAFFSRRQIVECADSGLLCDTGWLLLERDLSFVLDATEWLSFVLGEDCSNSDFSCRNFSLEGR